MKIKENVKLSKEAAGRFSSQKEANSFIMAAQKAVFMKKKYEETEQYMTLSEMKESGIYPYKYIDMDENAVVASVERKDGDGTFLVMRVTRLDSGTLDLPLSYRHSFEEGEEYDPSVLKMCKETFLEKEHIYCTDGIHYKAEEEEE